MMPKNLSLIQEADEFNEDRTESMINKTQLQFLNGDQSKIGSQYDGRPSPRVYELSYEMSPSKDGVITRLTQRGVPNMNDSWNANNISRITVPKMDISTSGVVDDSKRMDLLNNENMFEELDMGQIDEEERQFYLIDKDTGRAYDMRNEVHLQILSEKQTRLTTELNTTSGSSSRAWSDWWRQKHTNNQNFLLAAEEGDLDEVRKLLNKDIHQDLVADLNHKGLDQWTALHFAASEGRLEVVKELITKPDIEKQPHSSLLRTPLHMACMRGFTKVARVLILNGADKDVKDFDENTPLHCASEFGHIECIIFLIKEAEVNPTIKNKFGYTPSDIAQNMQIRQLFERLVPEELHLKSVEESKSFYGRTVYNGVLRHNDRVNQVKNLMHQYRTVDRFLQQNNNNEEVLIKKLEEQEAKAQGKKEENNIAKKIEKHEKKWKMKFIKIWQYNDQLQRELEDSKNADCEQTVGPSNFLPLMKLGQGSFGQVYLVEKLTLKLDGSVVNTGKQYAMKILNKKQILGNNLVKYAKTERDVLSYTKHPFIVGLKYAF